MLKKENPNKRYRKYKSAWAENKRLKIREQETRKLLLPIMQRYFVKGFGFKKRSSKK